MMAAKKTTAVHTSFVLPRELYDRWLKRIPRYGDRSKVLVRLTEMFLDGEVLVKTKERTF